MAVQSTAAAPSTALCWSCQVNLVSDNTDLLCRIILPIERELPRDCLIVERGEQGTTKQKWWWVQRGQGIHGCGGVGCSEAAAGAPVILPKVGHSNLWQGEAEVIQVWQAQAPANDAACSGTQGMMAWPASGQQWGGVWAAGHACMA